MHVYKIDRLSQFLWHKYIIQDMKYIYTTPMNSRKGHDQSIFIAQMIQSGR